MNQIPRTGITQPVLLVIPYGEKITRDIPNVEWAQWSDKDRCIYVRVAGLDIPVK